jgi:hypothetical protein
VSNDGFFIAAFAIPTIELDTSKQTIVKLVWIYYSFQRVLLPATGQKGLSVHFHRGFTAKLSSTEISIVGRVDVIMRQRLIHFHVDVKTIEPYWGIVVRHEITNETVFAQAPCCSLDQNYSYIHLET